MQNIQSYIRDINIKTSLKDISLFQEHTSQPVLRSFIKSN